VSSQIATDLTWIKHSNNYLLTAFPNGSRLRLFTLNPVAIRGQRYDYILMDSNLTDEEKCICRSCTCSNTAFKLGKGIPFKTPKDKRKNIVQEFTLADE
jgi:hypothetical protein